mmetsp:Transcript_79953/g.166240  ORF Transcript_79953/g.166240 Transcript_79953/m.166240 type:complete len:270 (-) Transcript_79953:333-1142(-)
MARSRSRCGHFSVCTNRARHCMGGGAWHGGMAVCTARVSRLHVRAASDPSVVKRVSQRRDHTSRQATSKEGKVGKILGTLGSTASSEDEALEAHCCTTRGGGCFTWKIRRLSCRIWLSMSVELSREPLIAIRRSLTLTSCCGFALFQSINNPSDKLPTFKWVPPTGKTFNPTCVRPPGIFSTMTANSPSWHCSCSSSTVGGGPAPAAAWAWAGTEVFAARDPGEVPEEAAATAGVEEVAASPEPAAAGLAGGVALACWAASAACWAACA